MPAKKQEVKQDEVQEERIEELKEGEVLDIGKLKEMNITTLTQVAKDLAVVGATGLRKQELIFKILQAQTEKNGLIFSEVPSRWIWISTRPRLQLPSGAG